MPRQRLSNRCFLMKKRGFLLIELLISLTVFFGFCLLVLRFQGVICNMMANGSSRIEALGKAIDIAERGSGGEYIKIAPNKALIDQLQELFGRKNIVLPVCRYRKVYINHEKTKLCLYTYWANNLPVSVPSFNFDLEYGRI